MAMRRKRKTDETTVTPEVVEEASESVTPEVVEEAAEVDEAHPETGVSTDHDDEW